MTVTDARRLFAAAHGLLLDLDGTLIDSSAPVSRAWSAFARRHRLDPDDVMRRASGRPSRETVRSLAEPASFEREERLLEEAECNDTAGTSALPGAAQLLGSGRPLAIVTSCSARLAAVRMRAAGLLPPPEIVISSDDVRHGKPDPEAFVLGARALGLEPGQCVVLEDSPAGVAAAIAAGAAVIAVLTTHCAADLAAATAVVDGLAQLL